MFKKKPIYIQIAKSIKKDIIKNKYKENNILDSEEKLIDQFNVSRTTIRSAISLLEDEGYVTKKQGKGTIINEIKTIQTLNQLTSFSETLSKKGIESQTSSISIIIIEQCSRHILRMLNLTKGDKIYLIQRTKAINDETIAFFRNYLVAKLIPDLDQKKEKIKSIGLYQVLEKDYSLKLHSAIDTISAYKSGPLESDILQIPKGEPLLCNNRIAYLKDGTPFEYCISSIRADKYEFCVYLKNRPIK